MTLESVWASQDIVVQGLFSGKAVVLIDGQRRIIAVGASSPEGVKLVAVNTDQAILEIDGKQQSYALGSSVSLNFKKAISVEEKVFANESGMRAFFGGYRSYHGCDEYHASQAFRCALSN